LKDVLPTLATSESVSAPLELVAVMILDQNYSHLAIRRCGSLERAAK
jgi:hypothetical protein